MKILLLISIISTAIIFSSCDKNDEGPHTVKYHVSSSSTMNVSYTDEHGVLKSASNVTSAWTYTFNAQGNGQIVKLIINSTNGSTVSGSIDIDGQEADQNDSNTGSVTLTAQIP